MNHLTLTVLSNNPPGGRCTLYTRYAEELSRLFGLNVQTIYPDESHDYTAPGLLIDDTSVTPTDGIIIAPNDICTAVKQIGLEIADLTGLHNRLDVLVEETIGEV